LREKIIEAKTTVSNAIDLVEKALDSLLEIGDFVEKMGFIVVQHIIIGFVESVGR